ncbi:MAG: TatD family hydrolase [Prevotella sp.]|nr:TatD family hydrolase [Prevotella sp.]
MKEEKKNNYTFIDTHAHLDGEEFNDDRDEVVKRAREAGVGKVFIPAINLPSVQAVLDTCARYPGFAFPMIGLHPEDVKDDWRQVLAQMKAILMSQVSGEQSFGSSVDTKPAPNDPVFIAIGEVGLDYYWSREFEKEQLEAFEEQVRWSIETRLPLMIHCRKAQNEMVSLLKKYERELPGGVFHCFTGNEKEAAELLRFERFVLGIGGVLTFKKSHLPEVLTSVPMSRIVLETDTPYMAPVPMRGKRNESAYVRFVLERVAECYQVEPEKVAYETNRNVERVFRRIS